jgi:hypothetical protein
VAGIGLLGTIVGTISGVFITQRRSDRREAAAWVRERVREREVWEREDVLRNFEARRDSYVSFYETLREMARTAYDHGMGPSEPPAERTKVSCRSSGTRRRFTNLNTAVSTPRRRYWRRLMAPTTRAGDGATGRDTAAMTMPSTTARRRTTTLS